MLFRSEFSKTAIDSFFNAKVSLGDWKMPADGGAVTDLSRAVLNEAANSFFSAITSKADWKKAIAEANKKGTVADAFINTLKNSRILGRNANNTAASQAALTQPVLDAVNGLIPIFANRKGPQWEKWRSKTITRIVNNLKGQKKSVASLLKDAWTEAKNQGIITAEELYRMYPELRPRVAGTSPQSSVMGAKYDDIRFAFRPAVSIIPHLLTPEGENPVTKALTDVIATSMNDPVLLNQYYSFGMSLGTQINNGITDALNGVWVTAPETGAGSKATTTRTNPTSHKLPRSIMSGKKTPPIFPLLTPSSLGTNTETNKNKNKKLPFLQEIMRQARVLSGQLPNIIMGIDAKGNPSEVWATGGRNAGKAWGNAWAEGAKDGVNTALLTVKATTVGQSPPPQGPLKNIDKGGYNIGHAWGSSMTTGAVKSLNKGMSHVRQTLDSQSREFAHRGNMDVTLNRNDKKHIQISLNVTVDGSANRATMSELRRGVMDALIMADLEHMVEVI